MILTEQKRIVVEYWWNDSDRAKQNYLQNNFSSATL